jgi:hypothetical protein
VVTKQRTGNSACRQSFRISDPHAVTEADAVFVPIPRRCFVNPKGGVMIDRAGLKKALTRIAAGVFFLCAYGFMLSEISLPADQAILWITEILFVLYGLRQYRKLKAIGAGAPEQSDSQKQKPPLMSTVMIPVVGALVIALYYFNNPLWAVMFYGAAGLWLFFSGIIRSIKLFMQRFTKKTGQEKTVIRFSVIVAMLIMFDAFVFASNFIMLVLLVLMILIPRKLFKAIQQRADRLVFKQQLISAGVYAIAFVLSIAAFNLNNDVARQRLITIAAVCEQYKQKYGEYPAELPKLIPEFINEIPAPKRGFLMTGQFRYSAGKDRHIIMYVKLPPFGRPYYVLETKQWGYVD